MSEISLTTNKNHIVPFTVYEPLPTHPNLNPVFLFIALEIRHLT